MKETCSLTVSSNRRTHPLINDDDILPPWACFVRVKSTSTWKPGDDCW